MTPHYHHTQIGWVIIVSLLAMVGVMAGLMALDVPGLALGVAISVLLLCVGLFATLTVTVDEQRIALRFGIGLVRKQVELAQIRSFQAVVNPTIYGWGIHGFPGGVLYIVSGRRAVELLLVDGSRVRVGTDEPDTLIRALERVVGKPAPLTAAERQLVAAKRSRGLVIAIAIVILLVGGIAVPIVLMSRPVDAEVVAGRLVVRSFIYGDSFDLSLATSVELRQSLPPRGIRTNGLALGPTLRGWFRLDGLGEGRVFVQADRPPFVLVRLGDGFVLVSLADPGRTRELYEQVVAATGRGP